MHPPRENQNWTWSPSDLVRFSESPFASWMDRAFAANEIEGPPDSNTEEQRLFQDYGDRHENQHLLDLKKRGLRVVEIDQTSFSAFDETTTAINENPEVIFQAKLCHDDFAGWADFLVLEADGPNGKRRYEIHDTKLASSAKPHYLLQLCCYAEMFEGMVGYLPERIAVVLGNGQTQFFQTKEYIYHYKVVKRAFLKFMAEFDPNGSAPPPDPRANHGRWQSYADEWIKEHDHLVQVAGITRGQIERFEQAGIHTVVDLAKSQKESVHGMGSLVLLRLKKQAAAQLKTRELQEHGETCEVAPYFEVIPPPAEDLSRGLGMLPKSSKGDIFFDIEGFPLMPGGLEYLLGASYCEDGVEKFKDWWAHDLAEEKRSFEAFIDWVYARWQKDPLMHIYHYAPYETAAVRRLMGRHATREEKVDNLLRAQVFIDLYRVVQQGILLGDSSYSIKKVEKLYLGARQSDVTDAMGSVVDYERWISSGEPQCWQGSPILEQIRKYNEEDCISTLRLTDWLRNLQQEHGISYSTQNDSPDDVSDLNRKLPEDEIRRHDLAEEILAEIEGAPDDKFGGLPNRIGILLAHLLNFYRREEKPVWWAKLDRLEKTGAELKDDLDCLGEIKRTSHPEIALKKSIGFEYSFDPSQDTKIGVGSKVLIREVGSLPGTVEEFDPEGNIVLKLGPTAIKSLKNSPPPTTISLLPNDFVSADGLKNSIERLVQRWRFDKHLPIAFEKFLLRTPMQRGTGLLGSGETASDACVRLASEMNQDVLIIQGPPGTGKTFTGSRMIVDLLKKGKKIGVLSNSHKAILNLLRAVAKRDASQLCGVRVGLKVDKGLEESAPDLEQLSASKKAVENYDTGLIAGTAWLFSREELKDKLDYLFIDEAGQISLAHLAAVSASTKNLVLLGDQMQLGQPIQGSHPGDSGQSALEYALAGHTTVPKDRGVLLDTSYRMHPALCRVISESFYEGRLHSSPETESRVLVPENGNGKIIPSDTKAGILFVPVHHYGCTQSSTEEARVIAQLTEELLSTRVVRPNGVASFLNLKDLLFVAPYNAQVRELRHCLPADARVGSVDRFQGQEAPVVIVSLCTSQGETSGRGLKFVLNRNRLNVALSRAQTLAIVVGDPRLSLTSSQNTEEMRLLNFLSYLKSRHPKSHQ
jgi:predicted RecB family nuclease